LKGLFPDIHMPPPSSPNTMSDRRVFATLAEAAAAGSKPAKAALKLAAIHVERAASVPRADARRLVRTHESDGETLLAIRAAGRPRDPGPGPAAGGRARARVAAVKDILTRVFGDHLSPVAEYLDIGCSEGGLTTELGAMFAAAKIRGCDVRTAVAPVGFEFRKACAEKLPYRTAQFEAVSFVMTLHHVRDITKALAEAWRVLKPGGILVVREHDCPDEYFGQYLDIVHYVYATVGGEILFDDPAKFSEHLPKFVTRYATRAEWADVIKTAGFDSIGRCMAGAHGRPDRFRGYFEVFVRLP
jgi:ubiquinone/menaquinone biosynthesis C-methylase UbiE